MSSESISIPVCVLNITEEGFDLFIRGRKYFVSREVFPWFVGASNDEILDIELFSDQGGRGDWIHWETLDVDLWELDFEQLYLKQNPIRMLTKDQWERLEKFRGEKPSRPYIVSDDLLR